VAGEGGVLGHWDGRDWAFETFPGEPMIMDLWGASSAEVWPCV